MLQGLKTFLRPLEEEDLDSLYSWYNDQEVNYWANAGWPLTTMLDKNTVAARYLDTGEAPIGVQYEYRFAILNEEKVIIGYLGFREMNVPSRSATVFINIGDKGFWGRGYGTDALLSFVHYLFGQWNFHRLHLDTWDGNTRAIKTYEKVGFQIEGRLREARYVMGEYRDALLFGLLQKDFFLAHPESLGQLGVAKGHQID
ncbi:MAG: GNAT family N-acetyltransferase [Desulfitobacteriaceae bacterium]